MVLSQLTRALLAKNVVRKLRICANRARSSKMRVVLFIDGPIYSRRRRVTEEERAETI